jgi:hypothetical protein
MSIEHSCVTKHVLWNEKFVAGSDKMQIETSVVDMQWNEQEEAYVRIIRGYWIIENVWFKNIVNGRQLWCGYVR